MSLTVKELLINHSRGIHSDIKVNDAQYFETEIPKFDDITEAREYKQELAEQIKVAEQTAKEEKEKALQARKLALKKKKELDAQIEKLEQPDPSKPPIEGAQDD